MIRFLKYFPIISLPFFFPLSHAAWVCFYNTECCTLYFFELSHDRKISTQMSEAATSSVVCSRDNIDGGEQGFHAILHRAHVYICIFMLLLITLVIRVFSEEVHCKLPALLLV